MKFDETKLEKMKEGSRQYLDQQERVLFGRAKTYIEVDEPIAQMLDAEVKASKEIEARKRMEENTAHEAIMMDRIKLQNIKLIP